MGVLAVAGIAGMGFGADELHQGGAAELLRHAPRRRLVDPHQRRMEHEPRLHAEIERALHRLDGIVATVRIAAVIGLAHARDDVLDVALIRHDCRERVERVGRRQAAGAATNG